MILTDRITKPPPSDSRNIGDSDSIFICSIIFKNKKYGVEGRKFGTDSICWDVEELGFVITSKGPIVFSFSELGTLEITQTFTMWHESGMGLLH